MKKPWCQKIKRPDGSFYFKKQISDPQGRKDARTGKAVRLTVTADTEGELAARIDAIKRVKRDRSFGLITEEEASRTVGAATRTALVVEFVWRRYVERRGDGWRGKLSGYWENHLSIDFKTTLLVDVGTELLERFEKRLVGLGYGYKTIKNVFDALAAAVRLAIKDGIASALPWGTWSPDPRGHKPKKRAPPPGLHGLALLMRAAAQRPALRGELPDLHRRIGLGALIGLRPGEIGALGWDDFERIGQRVIVTVRHTLADGWRESFPVLARRAGYKGAGPRPLDPPKGGEMRLPAALHPQAVTLLFEQREALKARGWYRPDGPVFPAPGGRWRSRTGIRPSVFADVWRDAGLPGNVPIGPHGLRRWFVTNDINAAARNRRPGESLGESLRGVMNRVGHKSLEQTSEYVDELEPVTAPAFGLLDGISPTTIDVQAQSVDVDALELVEYRGDLGAIVVASTAWDADPCDDEVAPVTPRDVRQAAARAAHERDLGRPVSDYTTAARAWFAAGCPKNRPTNITEDWEAAREAAKRKAERAGEGPDAVRVAGANAVKRRKGAWGLACSRERKRLAAFVGELAENVREPDEDAAE